MVTGKFLWNYSQIFVVFVAGLFIGTLLGKYSSPSRNSDDIAEQQPSVVKIKKYQQPTQQKITDPKSPAINKFLSPLQAFDATNFSAVRRNLNEACGVMLRSELCEAQLSGRHLAPGLWSHVDDGLISAVKSGVVLVLTFNQAGNYHSAKLVDQLYRHYFIAVYYCGPSGSEQKTLWSASVSNAKAHYLSPSEEIFLDYGQNQHSGGEAVYYCFNLAWERTKKLDGAERQIRGFLVISDDVIFNLWNLGRQQMDLDKSWAMFTRENDIYDIDKMQYCQPPNLADGVVLTKCKQDAPVQWMWASSYSKPVSDYYSELQTTGRWKSQFTRLVLATGGMRRVLARGNADVFYIAKQHFEMAADSFELLAKHRVFLEIAITTAFAILDPTWTTANASQSSIQTLDTRGENWGAGRQASWNFYRTDYLFVHPFKMSKIDPTAQMPSDLSDEDATALKRDRCLYCVLLSNNFFENDE